METGTGTGTGTGAGIGPGPNLGLMVESILSQMSLRQKIGQMTIVGFPERFAGQLPDGILSLLEDPGVGGVGIFARNASDPAEMAELTTCLQDAARAAGAPVPLLISADQEGGIVLQVTAGTTAFPGNMALAATGNPENAYESARIIGLESLAMGINAVTAPDVDVNTDADNPIIGVRAASDDPQTVAAFGVRAVQGFASAGVLCMAKHFPGHGRTSQDSHLGVPVLPGSIDQIRAIDLPPFAAAIAAGAPAVMTAHIQSLALDASGVPATLSQSALTGLLRDELGFDGLVITDCLEMGAIQQTVGTPQAAVQAVAAGADVVLMCHTLDLQLRAIDELEKAVRSGVISCERVDESCRRVIRAKLEQVKFLREAGWAGHPLPLPPLDLVGCADHLRAEERIARASVTLVRNSAGLLPLGKNGRHSHGQCSSGRRIAVVYPSTMPRLRAEDSADAESVLGEEIARRVGDSCVFEVGVELFPSAEDTARAIGVAMSCDLVVAATSSKTPEQEEAQGALVRALIDTGRPVVACAIRNPYDLRAYPQVDTYMATYGYRPCSIRAAVEVMFGEAKPAGRLPVSIPGLHSRGHGLMSFSQ
ncbi:MAG: glycoside hydrolase family 3 N-terminal domain-containing protein [Clostridia bacterium]|nr:glycoside hydrolase family 3 N-terminal domain-containing protein [Clostridia bacterium]